MTHLEASMCSESIDFDKVTMAVTEGGEIGEFQDIPETKFSISKDNLTEQLHRLIPSPTGSSRNA